MDEFIGKISSYHLFNYLFTGVLFVFLAKHFTLYSLVQDDLLIAAFFYYFLGLILSRIGSLFIEPLLKKVSFVNFADYGDYISATKQDATIEILSETNNMYRTLTTLFVSLVFLKIYGTLGQHYTWMATLNEPVIIAGLALMFLFSYKKQTSYIRARVTKTISDI